MCNQDIFSLFLKNSIPEDVHQYFVCINLAISQFSRYQEFVYNDMSKCSPKLLRVWIISKPPIPLMIEKRFSRQS